MEISAFGVVHKADELAARREAKRKAGVKAFFDKPETKDLIDRTFAPGPERKFNEEVGHGVSIRYKRPDGTTTQPKPKAAPPAEASAPKSKSGRGSLVAVGALGAGALALRHQNQKKFGRKRRG